MRRFWWLGTGSCALLLSAALPASRLEVDPGTVLEGEPVSIRIIDAPPGKIVTVHTQSVTLGRSGEVVPYYAHASFRIGADGTADVARKPSLSGSYYGTDIRGLFWSQERVVSGATPVSPAMPVGTEQLKPDQVSLTLQVDDKVEDRKVVTFVPSNVEVVREEVKADGIVGAFYHRRGAAKQPVVVILHGSEGGLGFADWFGPMLAARGYSVFGLHYFSPEASAAPGVPTAFNLIPVEELQRVRTWLSRRPEADVSRFGIVGASKGGEFAVLLGSIYPWVDAVVAFMPSAYVGQGFKFGSGEAGMSSSWSRAGKPLPFVPETGQAEVLRNYRIPGGEVRLAPVRKANMARASAALLAKAAIPVEHSHAAFLLAGGGDDQTGASGDSVRLLADRLRRFHYRRPVEVRIYPNAGHLIVGTGWRPTTSHNAGPSQDGGNAEADARAQADSWSAMIGFLRRNLDKAP